MSEATSAKSRGPVVSLPPQPYPGLRPFEKEEWPIFFGREKNIAEAVDRLIENQFLALHGDSGCGKSSLVRAGVMPRLEQDHARGGATWRTTSMLPRSTPLMNLATALASLESDEPDPAKVMDLRRVLNHGVQAAEPLGKKVRRGDNDYICLLVDQFEEIFYFAQNGGADEAQQFIDVLIGLQQRPAPGLHIALTMRSEFIGACGRYYGLAEAFNATQFLLPRMDSSALFRAVTEPARLYGGEIDPALAEALIAEGGREQDQLPLMQHALMLLQRQTIGDRGPSARQSWKLDLAAYRGAGGAKQLLSDHADQVFSGMTEWEVDGSPDRDRPYKVDVDVARYGASLETIVEDIFKALTTVNAEGHGIRTPRSIGYLLQRTGVDKRTLFPFLDVLSSDGVSFLKIQGGKPYVDHELVDITHEALIRNWGKLKVWMADERKFSIWLEEVSRDLADWVTAFAESTLPATDQGASALLFRRGASPETPTRGDNALLAGARLDKSKVWLDVNPAAIRSDIKEFIAVSAAVHEARSRTGPIEASNAAATELNSPGRERAEHTERVTAYVIYSRRDVELVDQVVIGLEDRGISVLIDRADISAADEWRQRLLELIRSADSIILALSASTLASRVGGWELGEAERLGKRIVPILVDQDGQSNVPDSILRLQWIDFTASGLGFIRALDHLVNTLTHDVGWVRMCAKFQSLADDWDARGQASARLLRGIALSEALQWASETPHSFSVSKEISKYLAASQAYEGRTSRRRRELASTALVIAVLLSGAAVTGGWFAWTQTVAVAQKKSDLFAAQADAANAAGLSETALLFALQAAGMGGGDQPRARASLSAAYLSSRLERIYTGGGEAIRSVAYSPNGERILMGSGDGTLSVWEVRSGEPLYIDKNHADGVWSVAFSPDGRRILEGSGDGTVSLTNYEGGTPVKFPAHAERVGSVAFSPDGKRIVTGSDDQTARIWDAESLKLLITLQGHTDSITSVAFSPDGKRVVTGSLDKTARVSDAENGKLLGTFHSDNNVTSVAFSPDGRLLLIGSADGTALVWNATMGGFITDFARHDGMVSSVGFSPDGRRILTASTDATARVWGDSGNLDFTLQGHTGPILSAEFSVDGRYVLTGSTDGTARTWNAQQDEIEIPLPIRSVDAFSPDRKHILAGSEDANTARVWDTESEKQLISLVGHAAPVLSVAFSPDGKRVATGSFDKTARVWDAESGKQLIVLEGHAAPVTSVAFSPDGKRVVTGSFDKTARVWEAESGKLLVSLVGHTDSVTSVAFSPDGQRLLTGSQDHTARMWDAESGKPLITFEGHTGSVTSIAFSPDGKHILTGSDDKTARDWDGDTGKLLITMQGHEGAVSSVAFSPDGRQILTGSDDRSARLWDLASGKVLLTMPSRHGPVNSVAFSPDGDRTLMASNGVVIRPVPRFLRSRAQEQVKAACEKLWAANAPLAFSLGDTAKYPVLRGEPVDPDNRERFRSPCKGIIPDEAFRKTRTNGG